ncbi:hypothetical protein C8R46DRAFT_1219963 [Mycena filopes]|nr:hypothetical protein C8R46DRAFT_1219963 [Mycena filopes]
MHIDDSHGAHSRRSAPRSAVRKGGLRDLKYIRRVVGQSAQPAAATYAPAPTAWASLEDRSIVGMTPAIRTPGRIALAGLHYGQAFKGRKTRALSHGDTLAPEPSVRLSRRLGRRLACSWTITRSCSCSPAQVRLFPSPSPPARMMLADAVALSFFDAADRLVATKDDVALRRGLRVADGAGAKCRRRNPAHERAARDGGGWQRDEEEVWWAQHADNAPPTTPSSTTTPTAPPSKRVVVLGVTVDLGIAPQGVLLALPLPDLLATEGLRLIYPPTTRDENYRLRDARRGTPYDLTRRGDGLGDPPHFIICRLRIIEVNTTVSDARLSPTRDEESPTT